MDIVPNHSVWTHTTNSWVIATWEPLPCGHYMQEEMPDQIVDHFTTFFIA